MSEKKEPHNGLLSKMEFDQLKEILYKGEPILIPSGVLTVHCRDCKYRHTPECFCKDPEHVHDNWSCSKGEFIKP